MTVAYDVAAIGNAIVDVMARADDAFLDAEGLAKGSMRLIDETRAHELYGRMAAGVEASGGSAANTIAGVASLGGTIAIMLARWPRTPWERCSPTIFAPSARTSTPRRWPTARRPAAA